MRVGAQGLAAGKWKVRVLHLLSQDELSFGELRNSITGVAWVLSSLLLDLIADGAVRHRARSCWPSDRFTR